MSWLPLQWRKPEKFLIPISLAIFLLLFGEGIAKNYKGAELRTYDTYKYGRFEVRMKSAPGSGIVSSFFTYYDEGGNLPAQWNEIDIEILGRYTNQVQFNTITFNITNHVYSVEVPFNPHNGFHHYAIEWTPYYVAWYVDGYEIYRQTGSHIAELVHPQKIMMNIWPPAASDWAGVLNPNALPAYAYYDWVQYSRYTPGQNDNFTLQWRDDFNSWDYNRWAKATHTWDGNNSDFVPENVVFRDGYMILCLTDNQNRGYNGGPVVDEDTDPPYLVWARAYGNVVKAFFSEPLDSASAQNPSNFIIPGKTVQAARLLSDSRTVAVQVDNPDWSNDYVLVVHDVADRASPPNVMGVMNKPIIKPLPLPLGINVGGDAAGGYLADQEWSAQVEYGAVGGTAFDVAPLNIQGASEPAVFQTGRDGVAFLQVRLPEGSYDVTLLLAETEYASSGQRVFDVYAEGQPVLTGVDIYAEVGGFQALEKTISGVAVEDGILDLYFHPVKGQPRLNGLRITPSASGIEEHSDPLPRDFSWRLFPNPVNGELNLTYRLAVPQQIHFQLVDVLGRPVRQWQTRPSQAGAYALHLDTNTLQSGVYFVIADLASGYRDVRKLVILK